MSINERRQALMPIIAQAAWDSAAEEEQGRREESSFGVDDSVRYWDDLEEFERKSLANQQSAIAIGIARAGWRPPPRVVETVEELRKLADDAVIRDLEGRAWFAEVGGVPSEALAEFLPVTVIYEGGDPS